MRPEDILERDFMVGLRGYDKDEVRSFLAEIASDQAALLTELETLRAAPPVAAPAPAEPAPVLVQAGPGDEFENLGASVAAILRAAKESSSEITDAAETQAAATLQAAETQATEIREAAERYAESVRRQADEVRESAAAITEEARASADAVLREANERAAQLDLETEARIATKIEEAQRRAIALKSTLLAASEELQLALVALDDEAVVDVREAEPASGWAG
jgi:DivIVA domain-containing protein